MIALTRKRTKTAIPKKFYSPNRVAWNIELLENERRIRRGEITNHDFDESQWKVVKEQLLKESMGKCVYCEAPASTVCYCDVEHYRPKSIYWWLVCSYENYLASCTLCNQKYKRDEFPIGGTIYPPPKVSKQTSNSQIRAMAPLINPDPLV